MTSRSIERTSGKEAHCKWIFRHNNRVLQDWQSRKKFLARQNFPDLFNSSASPAIAMPLFVWL
jgi:hypothetical protein